MEQDKKEKVGIHGGVLSSFAWREMLGRNQFSALGPRDT